MKPICTENLVSEIRLALDQFSDIFFLLGFHRTQEFYEMIKT